MKSLIFSVVLLLCAWMLAGCNTWTVKKLESYTPVKKADEIEVFAGTVNEPHRTVAIIQSRIVSDKSPETKLALIEQMKETAQKIGVDAIEEIRLLTVRIKGFVRDPNVPFPSFHQGIKERYILRGNGIIFSN